MPTPINISASRGAVILGLSKWSTPVNVWLQIMEARQPGFCAKNNYDLPVVEDNAPMRWGRAFESAIIELAERRQGHEIFMREKLGLYYKDEDPIKNCGVLGSGGYKSDYKYAQITCHIDGMYEDIPGTLHEGKTASYFSWADNYGDPGTDRVPIEYQIQCQHQMICTGAEKVILSVLVFPRRVEDWEEMGWIINNENEKYFLMIRDKIDEHLKENLRGFVVVNPATWAHQLSQMGYFHQYEIPANPATQERMIADYTDWWEKYVIGRTPPEPQSYADIKALMREPKGTIIASPEIESLAAERKQIMSEIKGTGPLAKRSDAIKVEILDYMRTHGADAVDDDSVDKMILRDSAGRKLGSYGKNKNGVLYFR